MDSDERKVGYNLSPTNPLPPGKRLSGLWVLGGATKQWRILSGLILSPLLVFLGLGSNDESPEYERFQGYRLKEQLNWKVAVASFYPHETRGEDVCVCVSVCVWVCVARCLLLSSYGGWWKHMSKRNWVFNVSCSAYFLKQEVCVYMCVCILLCKSAVSYFVFFSDISLTHFQQFMSSLCWQFLQYSINKPQQKEFRKCSVKRFFYTHWRCKIFLSLKNALRNE